MTRTVSVVVAAVVAALLAHAPAHAKSNKTVRWTYAQVWPTALRFLRIDQRCTIVDKDREAGYVVFELADDGKTFRGALELVKVVDDADRPGVKLVLRIDDRPSYMERGMLDRLERKLRDEHGEPRPPPRKKEEKQPDAPAKPESEAALPERW